MNKRQKLSRKEYNKRYAPANGHLWPPRGGSNPYKMEERLRDAMKPRQHGDVKIFTQEEIDELHKSLQLTIKVNS